MQTKSIGLIIYVKLVKDYDLFIKVLSSKDKIVSGLVYGGNSSKKRLTYQLGYFIEFNQLQKNTNSVNSINGEMVKPYIVSVYNDKIKLFALLSIISILNKGIYQGIQFSGLFVSVKDLIILINTSQSWLSSYCKWLLYFLKLLGYEIEYKNTNYMKYFNLNSLNFQKMYSNNSILFPYEILNSNVHVKYETFKSLITIFETVFKNNHLNNYEYEMPINYLNFKNLILKKLQLMNK